jgi:hypothetical protein
LFGLLLAMSGCTEIVSIDLNSAAPKLVVDGYVSNQPGPYTIRLSRSTNYFTSKASPPVSGAQVIISDDQGLSETLLENKQGDYQSHTLHGMPGRRYTLFVNTESERYTGSATLNDTVHIDSLSYKLIPPMPGSQDPPSVSVDCWFHDPAPIGNYYGLRLYKNSSLIRDISNNRVISDHLTNGTYMHESQNEGSLMPGDTVQIDLVTFDKSAYDFYNSLKQTLNTGNPFSAPPANPITNLSNGALGYFGAYAVTSKKIILK